MRGRLSHFYVRGLYGYCAFCISYLKQKFPLIIKMRFGWKPLPSFISILCKFDFYVKRSIIFLRPKQRKYKKASILNYSTDFPFFFLFFTRSTVRYPRGRQTSSAKSLTNSQLTILASIRRVSL